MTSERPLVSHSPVHTAHQSSTYNTPVQYITHQSSTYNTPVQYIQHTSPVNTSHQSSTYITPVQYIHHTSPVHSIVNTSAQYNNGTSPVHSSHVRVKWCRPITIDSVWIMVSLPTQLDLGFRISNTGIPKTKKFRALNNNQLVVKWCLGLQLDTSRGTSCALCPDVALDPLDHHAATCRHGGDVVVHHHKLHDVFLSFCHIGELPLLPLRKAECPICPLLH